MLWCLKIPSVSKTGVSSTFAQYFVFTDMKVFCAGFFSLPSQICVHETKGRTRVMSHKASLLHLHSEMQQTHKQTDNYTLGTHFSSLPAPQHRSVLLDLQNHENSTSTKEPLLCFLPGVLGVRQQLQTCREVMAGRIG